MNLVDNFDLDKHIKTRFQLFQGKRSEDTDRKIYDKVYAHCLSEMLVFVAENTTKEELDKISKRLDSEAPETVLPEALEKIPLAKTRLNARLLYFVNQLLLDTLERRASKHDN